MKLDVIKNAKRNIFFGVINRVVAVICPFITRTFIQYSLGEEYLGLNSLFTSILTVLSLSELGFGSAIIYSMYKPVAEGDTQLVNALLNFYRKAYAVIGTVILLVGLFIIPFLPYLISGFYPMDISLTALYLVYLANTAVSYFMYAYMSSLIVVYQRDDINSRINAAVTFIMMIAQILVLTNFRSYMAFCLLMPIFTVINNLRIAIVVKRMFPQYHCEGYVPSEIIGVMKKQIVGTFVSRICAVTRNSFDSICISAFLGLAITAMYNNYYLILSSVTGFLGIFASSLTGGIGNHVVTRDKRENYEELKSVDFVYMWVSGWCTICILCLSQPFMELWMGKRLMLPNLVVALLCVYFYILKIGDIRTIYSNVNGLWWQNRWRSIIEAIVNIVLNIVFARYFGIYGIISATLISLMFIHTVWSAFIIFKYYFGIEYINNYFKYHVKYAIVTIALCVLTWFICNLVPKCGLVPTLLCRAVICFVFPNLIYLLLYNKSPYFVRLKGIARHEI